ncbi:TPA: fimbrial protein [Serratia marcescens]
MRHNMIPFAGLLMALAAIPAASAAENFKLHGALVAEPCSLQSGDESIELNFGNIVDKYLYTNQRTHGKAFSLRLIDCDISLGKGVQISFSGAESLALPGLLALAAGSQAQGVAIGFETSAGQPLPLHAWECRRHWPMGTTRSPCRPIFRLSRTPRPQKASSSARSAPSLPFR